MSFIQSTPGKRYNIFLARIKTRQNSWANLETEKNIKSYLDSEKFPTVKEVSKCLLNLTIQSRYTNTTISNFKGIIRREENYFCWYLWIETDKQTQLKWLVTSLEKSLQKNSKSLWANVTVNVADPNKTFRIEFEKLMRLDGSDYSPGYITTALANIIVDETEENRRLVESLVLSPTYKKTATAIVLDNLQKEHPDMFTDAYKNQNMSVELQNTELQNTELQNIEFQNTEERTEVQIQGV